MREDAFRRLPEGFSGTCVTGLGFDRETLESADIAQAYAFAAVSDGDNSNILAARVARETYGVEHVVARIADSDRAEVYRRLGIDTVAPVPWTVTQIVSGLLPSSEDEFVDESGSVSIRRLRLHDAWAGQPYARFEEEAQTRVAYVMRDGMPLTLTERTMVQARDEAYVVIPAGKMRGIERVSGHVPGAKS